MSKNVPQINLPGLALDRSVATPLQQQVYEQIRSAITNGSLAANTRLPSTRSLARDWGVSRNVVLLAFEQLVLEGYLHTKTGSGTFVAPGDAPLPSMPPKKQDPLSVQPLPGLSTPSMLRQAADRYIIPRNTVREESRPFQISLPSLRDFPFPIWSRLAVQVYRGLHIRHLGYDDAAGYRPLREAIAAHVQVNRAVRCTAEQVVIVNGTQQGLFLAGALLLQQGDQFWMEDPGYQGALASLCAGGGVPCPVPVGPEGIDLDYAFTQYPAARVAYVTPSHQYPMGATMPYPARKRLLEWAAEQQGWIIEDDYDSELCYSGRPLPSLQGLDQAGRVLYIGTFSKTLFPALRLAYLILPDAGMAQLFTRAKALIDRQHPLVEQMILTEFMVQGHFGRHIRRMRQLYKARQECLLQEIQTLPLSPKPFSPDAGMNLLAWLPESLDDRELSKELAKHGIIAPPLSDYVVKHQQQPALLLGYAAFTAEQIHASVSILARVLHDFMQR